MVNTIYSNCPTGMFISPDGSNRQEVETLMQTINSTVLEFLGRAQNYSMVPDWDGWLPNDIFPHNGVSIEHFLADLRNILQRSMNPANPNFVGHMDTVASVPGIMGEFVTAAINNNMLSVEMSPLLSRLENACMREIANWFDLGAQSAGTMVSGGTLANLLALTVARNDALHCQRSGYVHSKSRPVIFASEVAHSSIQKAAMILGIGTEGVIPIAVDDNQCLRIDALEHALRKSRTASQTPFCVVATAGTTTAGAIDPLEDIATLCANHSVWFHVDAAYGGAVILSEKHRHLLKGINHADSITFNPQKWLYLPKTCVATLFRNQKRWHEAFRIGAPYMRNAEDIVNLGEVSIQGTRHADVLKLWMSMNYAGKDMHAALIDESIHLTSYFIEEIKQRPYLTLATQPKLNVICFRGKNSDSLEYSNSWNARLQNHLSKQCAAFFSLPTLNEKKWLRAVLLNPHLTESHVSNMFKQIDTFSEQYSNLK